MSSVQAIVLCLDLSESMNKESGVSRLVGRKVPEEDEFDFKTESFNLVNKLAKDVSKTVLLENGENRFLARQEQKKRF
jgi:hypothetical protein